MNEKWWRELPEPPSARHAEAALDRQNQLTKPPGSLGRLEQIAVQLAAMQGVDRPEINKVLITIFAADHGVAAQNVSAFPQVVTTEMIRNFARGGAAISVLAKHLGAQLVVVDVGSAHAPGELPGVRNRRIAAGTADFTAQAAMTPEQLEAALSAGRDIIDENPGLDVFIGGEMGIANTTAASAMACALLALDPADMAGPGTGLDKQGVAHKAEVIRCALKTHEGHLDDPAEIMRRVGGFEIAALTGAFIRAARKGAPVLVDGFICSVAALAAVSINPAVRDWLIFSHESAEPGHARVLQAMDAEPLLSLGMRLGEGSGAAVAVPLLKSACALHNGMATFAEAGVSPQ